MRRLIGETSPVRSVCAPGESPCDANADRLLTQAPLQPRKETPMTRSTRHRTARARRRLADRVRARPRLEGLEDRCLLSNTITEYPVPTASAGVRGLTAGPDGNLWFTENPGNKVGMVNPTTHAISEFAGPTAKNSTSGLEGIVAGPDGNLWFTEFNYRSVGKIGEINPTTHAISEFAVPTAKN